MAERVAIVLPIPMKGHIIPMLTLAKRMGQLGLRCYVINVEAYLSNRVGIAGCAGCEEVTMLGLPMPCTSKMEQIEEDPLLELLVKIRQMRQPFEQMLAEILGSGKATPVCLLADSVIPWAQDVADEFGIPRVSFATTSSSFELIACYLPQLMAAGVVPLCNQAQGADQIIPTLASVLPLTPRDIPYMYEPEHPVIDALLETYQKLPKAIFSLVNSASELEPLAIDGMAALTKNYFGVGPLFPFDPFDDEILGEMRSQLEPDQLTCLEWLDKRHPRSVLYVSFGTVVTLSPTDIEAIGQALESSKQPFIWVIRSNKTCHAPNEFLEDFKRKTIPYQGLVMEWAPQKEILSHPSIGGFLTHSGWNSTLESLSFGVPMLACPRGSEQNLNCKIMVEHWKIGLRINDYPSGSSILKHKLEQGIRILMHNDEGKEMRLRATKLREAVKHSLSHTNLKCFVEYMCSFKGPLE